MRTPLFAGNWKMHKTNAELPGFFDAFTRQVARSAEGRIEGVDVMFAAPYTLLATAVSLSRDRGISIAAQNVHAAASGAYTGEVSIPMLKELGVGTALVGHSERRQLYAETDASVAEKAAALLGTSMTAVVCVGESLEERESARTEAVVSEQLNTVLGALERPDGLIIAYEPVWAIGTGRTATPAQAQAVHRLIRELVLIRFGDAAADRIHILYGGSAKPDNIESLLCQPDIDGALVGGASLQPEDFAAMVRAGMQSTD